ncbi:SDR family NAD(P)-dependent oxidoreductase [Frondihabitans australicus]|uniref:Short-subunit dehydrogenase n=1 Tax=Frondihabitans australicus TaxID=386892 RepID=A0A495IH70_9MICO|nr:SDR family NAD(P)-dependent oxidoreductase [Frondihabitans australicus]RKR75040.1 short-subunit dehydrogenase [Frondihabitans australicus]
MNQKVALITGAGRELGLGFATARLLAEQGHHAIVTARSQEQADTRASELRSLGLDASALVLDLADVDAYARVARRVEDDFGRLDVLVNNASTMPDMGVRSMLDVDIREAANALQVDVVATWGMTQAFRGLLEASPEGRVVNVSSRVWVLIPAAGSEVFSPAHAFAKFAVNTLSTSLAGAFTGTRVLVNAVDPGQVATHPELGLDPEDVPAAEAARWVAWAATLPADGPTGGVWFEGEPAPTSF